MASYVEESPDIISPSPETCTKDNKGLTPLSRNQGNRPAVMYMGRNLVTSKSSKDRMVSTVPDSDSDDESYSISSHSIKRNEFSKSCVLLSDLESSGNNSNDQIDSKESFIDYSIPLSDDLHVSNSNKKGMMSSTPSFDPATPVGAWRNAPSNLELSDDESPIVAHSKKRLGAIIESDTDSENESSDVIDDSEDSESHSIYEASLSTEPEALIESIQSNSDSDFKDGDISESESEYDIDNVKLTTTKPINESDSDLDSPIKSRPKNIILSDSDFDPFQPKSNIQKRRELDQPDHNIKTSSKSPFMLIDDSESPPSRGLQSDKANQKTTSLYNGKYKIKPRRRPVEDSINDISNASSNTSVSSTKSLDISNMTQEEIENKIKSNKRILKTANIAVLPDRGAKLKEKLSLLEEALVQLKIENEEDDDVVEISSCSNDSVSSKGTYSSYKYERNKNNRSIGLDVEILPEVKSTMKSQLENLKEELAQKQMVYKATNLRALPDGGLKLKEVIAKLEREIMILSYKEKVNKQFDLNKETKPIMKPDVIKVTSGPQYRQTQLLDSRLEVSLVAQAMATMKSKKPLSNNDLATLYSVDRDYGVRDYGGKLSDARAHNIFRMTADAVNELHDTLKSMPDVEADEETQPEGLKVELMPHQKRALKWLLWRESQMPPGGILADDMGLGKTLTMLSLILRHKELVANGEIEDDFDSLTGKPNEENQEEQEKWLSKGRKRELTPSKGTLIVCPASLLGQWEGEVTKRLHKNKLSVIVYHGNNRNVSLSRLAKFDVVVTTYNLIGNEAFSGAIPKNLRKKPDDSVPEIEAHNQGPIFRVGWTRIILDEGHVIRNHKTKSSQSVCMLRGGRRWVVTGTPVQNKELDFYSLVRFLRVSPFDDYTCWKHQLSGSSANSLRKLNLLVKSVLLRRTKDQVDQVTGKAIVELPNKELIQHKFALTQEEREVYDRVFAFSRNSLIEYMKSQEEKEKEKAEKLGQSFKSQFAFTEKKNGDKYTPTLPGELFKQDMKGHHMLVLLLRLRQICCHPALIQSIIEEESKKADGLTPETAAESDLISQMGGMSLGEPNRVKQEEVDEEIDNRVLDEILTKDNPVFNKKMPSSKITKVMEELAKMYLSGTYEKAVIVSQWTSMLEIVFKHLKNGGFNNTTAITGNVLVKDRAGIVEDFNKVGKGPRILLLSLVAGGVGLNLIGANHLFLLDMHWNPQLEAQACDRIYRVGQLKDVKIHRFVVENTVEEKILQLQSKKIELADAVLTGAKRTISSKLTLQDIKALFSISE